MDSIFVRRAALRRAGQLAPLLAALCLLGVAAHDLLGVGEGPLTRGRDALFLLVVALSATAAGVRAATGRTHRLAWALMAGGMVLWMVGFTVYLELGVP